MARIKPVVHIIGDLAGVEAALAEMAEIQRKTTEIELEMQETIDTAKANAKSANAPLVARHKELEAAMATYCTTNKADLFTKKKSLDLGYGSVGFRLSTKLKNQSKVKNADVLEQLHNYGFTEAITIKESINKEAMREWTDEKLATVGMTRVVSDEFFADIKKDKLEG